MFQLDDNFLEELGLGALPPEQKQAFLQHTYEQLEQRVGERLSDGMTDQQLREFEAIIDRNEENIRDWLRLYVPDFQADPFFQKLQASSGLPVDSIALQAEFAASRWLELNRPDYKAVVQKTLEEIKEEISRHKDAILGSQ